MKPARFSSAMVSVAFVTSLMLEGCSEADEPDSATAGIDESFLDRSVSPCTDFYQFACGTWIREHPTDTTTAIQRFYEGDNRNAWLLDRILEGDSNGSPFTPHANGAALGAFYGACRASRTMTLVDHGPIDQRLDRIASITNLADLASVLSSLHTDGIAGFFYLYAGIDPGNPARSVATVVPDGLGLPDRSYYLDPSEPALAQYRQHIQRMAPLYGAPFSIDASAVISIETALAEAMLASSTRRDPVATYNLLSFDAFTSLAKNFPWATYLAASGTGTGDVNVTDPAFLMKLDLLLGATPLEGLKSYLRWHVLESYAFTLGKSFVAEEAVFHYGVFRGDPTPAADWWACLGSTKWALGFELSQPFVAIRFDDAKRKVAADMIGAIKRTFGGELATRTWLDDSTRTEANGKLDQVLDKVGYPEIWPNPPGAQFTGSFAQQVFSVAAWMRRRNVERLSTPVDRSAWYTAPCVTNAFYSPWTNDITFPAAILQIPVFDPRWPRAVNFGTVGSVMGHELTHGFDDMGRHFDGQGKLRDWWTAAVGDEFTRRATCVVDQYSAYEPLAGLKIDGRLTLGENIADLGGLKLAYGAYKAAGDAETFAGSFNSDQQFFLAYAQQWCSSLRDEVLETRIRTDPHAPPQYRVNGVVRNLPEFAAAFRCDAGSPMAPADRCEVW